MDFGKFHFGRIEIDGVIYERDVVIDRGRIRKRKKKPSKRFREEFGHTPLSIEEEIPWKCQRLVVGTGRYVAPIAYVIDPKGRTAIEDKASVRSTLGRSPDLAEALMLAAGDADRRVDVDFQRRAQAAFAAATAARTSGPISDGPALGARMPTDYERLHDARPGRGAHRGPYRNGHAVEMGKMVVFLIARRATPGRGVTRVRRGPTKLAYPESPPRG